MNFEVDDIEANHALDYNQTARQRDFGVDNGCDVSINTGNLGSGGNALTVAAGDAMFNGNSVSVSSQSVDIDTGGTNPRQDVVYLDSTGSVVVSTGTPEAVFPSNGDLTTFEYQRPAPNDLSETDAVVLCAVWVAAGATSISASDVRDRRVSSTASFTSVDTDKLSITDGLIDVREHGAVGDGVTDNTTALQAAHDDANATGATVFYPAGDFYIGTQLNLDGHTDYRVVGTGAPSIIRADDHENNGLLIKNASGLSFEHLHTIGNTAATNKQQCFNIETTCSNITVENCLIEDWAGDGIVWLHDCHNIKALNNTLLNLGDDGINPGGDSTGNPSRDGVISDNYIEGATNDGIHLSVNSEDHTVTGNVLNGCSIGILSKGHTVSGNVIKNAPNNAITTRSSGSSIRDVSISANTIRNPGNYGVNIVHGSAIEVVDNTIITPARGVYVSASEIDVDGNRVSQPTDYGIVISTGAGGGPPHNGSVSNNKIESPNSSTITNDGILINAARCTVNGNMLTDSNIRETSNGDYNTFVGNHAPGGLNTTDGGANTVTAANITA